METAFHPVSCPLAHDPKLPSPEPGNSRTSQIFDPFCAKNSFTSRIGTKIAQDFLKIPASDFPKKIAIVTKS